MLVMMNCCELNLAIRPGASFEKVFRGAFAPIVYREITGLLSDPPARLVVPEHGMPDGWYAAVVSAKWAKGLNACGQEASASEYRPMRVIDKDTRHARVQ